MLLLSCTGVEIVNTKAHISDPISQEVAFTKEEFDMLKYLDNRFVYSEVEARKQAVDIAAILERKDGAKRTIGELQIVNLPLQAVGSDTVPYTKTDSTPELYIYNFANNLGYVILSADERFPTHFASSGGGAINKDMHAGLAILLENAIASVFNGRKEFQRKKDSILQTQAFHNFYYTKLGKLLGDSSHPIMMSYQHNEPIIIPDNILDRPVREGRLVEIELGYVSYEMPAYENSWQPTIGPLLKTHFHQGHPYNMEAPHKNSCYGDNYDHYKGRAPIGCVPIAYAQLLLFYNTAKTRERVGRNLTLLRNYYYGSAKMEEKKREKC